VRAVIADELGGGRDLPGALHRAGAGHDREAVPADQQIPDLDHGVGGPAGPVDQQVVAGTLGRGCLAGHHRLKRLGRPFRLGGVGQAARASRRTQRLGRIAAQDLEVLRGQPQFVQGRGGPRLGHVPLEVQEEQVLPGPAGPGP
jgi:hypothetical protein